MSSSPQKPDLEDSINVSEAHGRVEREVAAAARENRIADNGTDPINLWVLGACGVVIAIFGWVIKFDGGWFSYDSTFQEGYVRASAPGAGDSGPVPKEALAAYINRGAKIYGAKCNGCHGGNAQGDGANYPTLVGSEWVLGDTERFAMIILNGLQGPTSSGKDYPGAMPSQAPGLSAEDLAGVMTYVRNNFGNTNGDVVTVEMAAAAMDLNSKRPNAGMPVDATELAKHVKALPGEPLDPKTMVDPITLLPVDAAP